MRRRAVTKRSLDERISDAVTAFAGTMPFVYVHGAFLAGWILVNLGLVPGIRPFDPVPFTMLAMFASVEAIFLSTFVLITQNRMARLAEKHAELDLHVNLLAEREATHLLELTQAIARKLGVPEATNPAIDALKQTIEPEDVLEHLDEEAGR